MNSKKVAFRNKTNTQNSNQYQSLKIGTTFKESAVVCQKDTDIHSKKIQEIPNPDNQFNLKPLNSVLQRKSHLKNQVKIQIPKDYLPVYLQNYKNYPGKQLFGNKLDIKINQDMSHHKSLWQKQVEKNKLWEIQMDDQIKYKKGQGKRNRQPLRSSKVVQYQIFQPIPAKKLCQICRYEYDDYLHHLQEGHHRKTLKQTVGNYYIEEQAKLLQQSNKQLMQSQDFLQILSLGKIVAQQKSKIKQSIKNYCLKKDQIRQEVKKQYTSY